ncbi:traB domain-containing protein isoform X1 [Maniola hyperantus]|uniref:traB domain-containing protein isoform X1 n=1 Tax=Aphantopus hyperantus TaxID=2795564 RepID=UPI001569BDCF|nr:traB domain-containing protein-like isoform X1 [Maniola hyperantus]XP_034824520.1 traB domain-containing protein-like isoform X1 [Maniola hyperantus]
MDSDGEKEQLLIGPSKPNVRCDIVNECQMFLKSEEGGGDAHTNMNQNIAPQISGRSNFITPTSYETKEPLSNDAVAENTEFDNGSTKESLAEAVSETDLQSSDNSLPSTVTVLDAPDGGKVYLVGTAHFSLESQEDVSKVIQQVCPHVVMVELCEQRTNILLLDEEVILREAKNINIAKIKATMAQNGVFNGLMYILLLNMSAHITRELGMAPGGEFRRAMAEAKKIRNCIVQLGDRAIDITLHRAIASLSWGQTIRFIWHLLTSNQNISLEEVEKCKQKKMLEDMLEEMAEEFPALKRVFVVERDMYLCHSLQIAALQARREPCRIVGVVGIGHVAGIVEHWGKIESQDIAPLLKVPPPSLSTRIIRVSVRAACAGALLFAVYKMIPRRWLP